ncbi:Protein of unknown function DUF247, plant [Cynara cardunculus var. scolymus]|uniref:Uncharacterized protein n=1 Tax=Cynara cardunculus var. scolymus TaxID=59895 RepID=A0A118K1Z4_CYNCS|nr:Protein of unknown function DUF247, plant [Cynara cardunculus var. scolymus]
MALQDGNIASGIQISNEDQESDEAWLIKWITSNADPPPSSTRRIPRLPTMVFTKMMILDGCFILYYIQSIYGGEVETCELNSHQIVFVHQDLFLLENQIPFQVLTEVMNLVKINRRKKIKDFIYDNFLASVRPKRGWFCAGTGHIQEAQTSGAGHNQGDFNFTVDHLLQFLHHTLTGEDLYSNVSKKPHLVQTTNSNTINKKDLHRCTFRNVNELIDVGINFKPSSIMGLTQIGFSKRWWLFSADVELPPITVDDSTKSMVLNLITHEMCSADGHEAWVTSYICLLDSLIDHPEDVKALRKAGVLDNSLGSDKEVAKLFNEIGTDLVPNIAAYAEAKNKIQKHYGSLRNTRLSELKHEYIKSPWAFLALVGAVMALVLSGVQTYFTAWTPKSQCDDLCMFLKMNHHL